MSGELETARRYRAHAAELRLIAEGMKDEPNQCVVIDVARDYEKMANSLEALHRSNTSKTTRFDHLLF